MVYFVQMAVPNTDGPVKVGYSHDAEKRISDLRTASPYPLELLGIIVDGDRNTEQMIHLMFRSERLRGEWFSFSRELKSLALDAHKLDKHLVRAPNSGRPRQHIDNADCQKAFRRRQKEAKYMDNLPLVQKEHDVVSPLKNLRALTSRINRNEETTN